MKISKVDSDRKEFKFVKSGSFFSHRHSKEICSSVIIFCESNNFSMNFNITGEDKGAQIFIKCTEKSNVKITLKLFNHFQKCFAI